MAAFLRHLSPNVQFQKELLSTQQATGDFDGALIARGLAVQMKKKTGYLYGIGGVSALVVIAGALWLLTNFRGFKDSFRPDTLAGSMQLSAQVADHRHKDIALRTQMGSLGGELVGFQVLTGKLPVGAEVRIDASLPRTGTFSEGGGWIFAGRRYYGAHAVAADIVAADSSRPDILAATLAPSGSVRLIARKPGESTISLTARKRPHGRLDFEPAPAEDMIEFRVVP